MADRFSTFKAGLAAPADTIFEISPNDAADLPEATRGLNVAQSGQVRVTTVSGSTATLYITAGVPFPVRVTRVFSTGTSASGIVGLS